MAKPARVWPFCTSWIFTAVQWEKSLLGLSLQKKDIVSCHLSGPDIFDIGTVDSGNSELGFVTNFVY